IGRRMRALLDAEPLARVDYLAVVDDESLAPVLRIERPTLVALAVFFGRTRLIDNIILIP
ncbi:MAG: pantoate--beta-alanine ligase, partial [Bacteroidota bacterium]